MRLLIKHNRCLTWSSTAGRSVYDIKVLRERLESIFYILVFKSNKSCCCKVKQLQLCCWVLKQVFTAVSLSTRFKCGWMATCRCVHGVRSLPCCFCGVGYRLNLINSDSAYRFRFFSTVSIPKWLKNEVKHLDSKHIYSVSPFAKQFVAAVYNEQKSAGYIKTGLN